MTSRCLQIFVLALVATTGKTHSLDTTNSKTHANLRRVLLTPPKDLYAMKITNKLSVAVNSTFTFSKGMTTQEVMIEKKLIAPGASFTSGPYDYKEGSATFQYILQTVKVKNWPVGAGYSEQQALWLDAPFEGVTGVTKLMELEVLPAPDDKKAEKLGGLVLKAPAQPAV